MRCDVGFSEAMADLGFRMTKDGTKSINADGEVVLTWEATWPPELAAASDRVRHAAAALADAWFALPPGMRRECGEITITLPVEPCDLGPVLTETDVAAAIDHIRSVRGEIMREKGKRRGMGLMIEARRRCHQAPSPGVPPSAYEVAFARIALHPGLIRGST